MKPLQLFRKLQNCTTRRDCVNTLQESRPPEPMTDRELYELICRIENISPVGEHAPRNRKDLYFRLMAQYNAECKRRESEATQ